MTLFVRACRARRLAAAEKSRAKRHEAENKAAIAARAAQFEELEHLAQTQVSQAKTAHISASERVNESTKVTRGMVDRLREFEEEQWQDRTAAVLELRANQNAVRAKAATQSAKYNQKIANQRRQLEEEKESMLAKGLNPYAEFRRRDIEEEDRAQEERIKASVERNKAALAERLIKEEEIQRKAEMAEKREKAYEKRHREELGNHITEARNREYLRSVTTDGVEMLDPTGRAARIDPSKITDIPDYSFGLGKSARVPPESMKRIVEKIRGNLKVDREELGEYSRFVRSQSAATREAAAGQTGQVGAQGSVSMDDSHLHEQKQLMQYQDLASKSGAMPAAEGTASAINLAEDGDVEKLLQIVGDDAGVSGSASIDGFGLGSATSGKYKTVQLTKFEQDCFERAKERQQKRVEEGTQQVAGGKVFKGQAFVAHPSVIEFVDFDVGKTYRKRFILTNTSYTFNSFRILPLADDVIDFFEITFDKPGRMSAGVSCSIDVRFSPKLNQDIDSCIGFYSETGPVQVPLKCFVKRCQPEIINPTIDFGSIVVGQKMRIALKVKNTGALPSRFTVNRLEVETESAAAEEVERSGEGGADDEQPESESACVAPSRRQSLRSEVVSADTEGEELTAATNMAELNARVQKRLNEAVQCKLMENPHPLSVESGKGIVNGYGEASVIILCAPLYVGKISQKFSVTFEDVDESMKSVDSQGNYVRREQIVEAVCLSEELPIFLTDMDVNFKTTLHGRIYRKKFELRNRSSNTCAVSIKIPPPFNLFIEVNPTIVYVQSGMSQTVNTKFAPDSSIVEKLKYFSVVHEQTDHAACLMVPVEIQVANQELPVFFLLKTDVCSSRIRLSHHKLSFDSVYVSQQKTLQMTAKNTSMLPQKLAFTNLRKEISVMPNDGFAVLLPNEEVVFEVSLRPFSAVNYNINITLTTSFNDTYIIKANGLGVEPVVMFDSPVLYVRPTVPGEKVVENVVVRNTTQHKQCVEIVTPDPRFTWVKISPTVVELSPQGSARLEIEFSPPFDITDDDPKQWHMNLVKARDEKTKPQVVTPFSEWHEEDGWVFANGQFGSLQWTTANWRNTADEEEEGNDEESMVGVGEDEWGVLGRYHIPMFVKPANFDAVTKDNRDELMARLLPPLYLNLETVVKKPDFIADSTSVDFGQMAVGTRVLRTIKLRNVTLNRDMDLRTNGLNAVGPFSIVNASRAMYPSQWHTLVIECKPMLQGLVVEVLELSSTDGGPRINVSLRVQGVNPTVEISGLDPGLPGWSALGGILNFADVVACDVRNKRFTITNKSLFPIKATLERALCAGVPSNKQSELIQRTADGLPLFSCRPEFAMIPQGESVEVEMTFRPDRARPHPFREDINIRVGKGDDPIKICAIGRATNRQMFVRTIDPTDEPFYKEVLQDETDEDLLLVHPSQAVRTTAKAAMLDLGLGLSATQVIKLFFPDPFKDEVDNSDDVKSVTRKVAVCAADILDGRGGTGPGSYEVKLSQAAIDSKYFSVQNDKGNVTPGGEVVVAITCTVKRPRGLGGLEVGSWQNFNADILLKGGWKPDGEETDFVVPIVFSAYIRL